MIRFLRETPSGALPLILLLLLAPVVPLALYAQEPAAVEPEPSPADAALNSRFLDPDEDPQTFVDMFESESREVYQFRHRIVDALGLEAGDEVADIGAGSGLFSRLFAEEVGSEGRVFAVDISENLLEYMDQLNQEQGIDNVETVLGGFTSPHLPPRSVDLAFVCDTYHHFGQPHEMLTSIREVLREDGRLVIVDFERDPEETDEWVLEHVRAGQEVVTAEVQAAGFRLVREIPLMETQYVLVFEPAETAR
jgi:cyclopropane fatty-acyl-phospholipid synthase-like methyltransferase